MAGDWIKMRTNLDRDPAVVRISSGLETDRFAVVGRLHTIWAWANEHLVDGQDVPIDSAFLDALVECPGFAEQMRRVGWLSGRDGSLDFPGFERHNGASAKARAMDAERKKSVRKMSGSQPDETRTREEKRREEPRQYARAGGEPPNGVEPGEADGDPAEADAAPVGSRESGALGREPEAAPGGESRLSRIAQDGRPGSEPAGDTPTPEKANGAAPRAAAGGARAPDDPWRSPGWAHDEWARIAAAWNATDRAVPWTLVTPPNGFADLAASPGWLASALAGIAMLPDCRRFARPVPWTQFVRDLDRILAGEFRDPPPERRELAGAAAGGRPQRRGNMR
jgi:hypothetical protein